MGLEGGGGAPTMDPVTHTTAESFTLAYSIMDSSRVSTFFISILLIVYGSFRSLSMEDGKGGEEGEEKEKKESNVTTLDSLQAMCLPLGASFSLLIMFFFFDSMQLLFAVCTAVIATVALAFLLLPMCQYLVRPCTNKVTIIFFSNAMFMPGKSQMIKLLGHENIPN